MLNKDLCLLCNNKVIKYMIIQKRVTKKHRQHLLEEFDTNWEKGRVFCFYAFVNEGVDYIFTHQFHELCPYLLEHTVNQGIK